MGLTSRKKRPLDHTIPHLHDARLIVIATEGAETERQYFAIFHSVRVQVKVLPTVAGKSSPEHVFERLAQLAREHDMGLEDQLWVMIDVDRWPRKTLSEVAQESKKRGFELAVSSPCFELWLYLHHRSVDVSLSPTAKQMKKMLSRLLGGYDHTNVQAERFKPFVKEAVCRAEDLDANKTNRWPQSVGTHVYRVVKEIQRLMERQEQER